MEEKLLNNKKNGMGVLLALIASFIVATMSKNLRMPLGGMSATVRLTMES